jgi:hypothetical protein
MVDCLIATIRVTARLESNFSNGSLGIGMGGIGIIGNIRLE